MKFRSRELQFAVRGAILAAFVVAVALSAVRMAQTAPDQPGPVESSYQRARAVLNAGTKALGAAPDDISFRVNGQLFMRQQSPSSRNIDGSPLTAQYTIDLAGARVAWEVATSFPGGFQLQQGTRINKDQQVNLNNTLKTTQAIGPGLPQTLETFHNRIPQSLLARATQRANTLRWVGEGSFRGRKHNVVSFATVNGTEIALWFDAQANILSKWETFGSDPYLGDVVTEFAYKGWQTVGTLKFPTGQVISIAGEPAQDYDYSEVRVNAKPGDDVFAVPAGYTAFTPPTVPLNVNKLADDVYLIEGLGPGGGYSSLVVAFNDYVLVVEAPIGDGVAKNLLQKIRETIPGKPIRYVANTHHHSDHAGGIRTFIAEGVAIVTTPGNVAYFEKTAKRRFTLPPDSQQLSLQKPKFETITGGKRVFTDGTHTVELIDIGPNPHASELLVAWLPKERILFEGDMFFKNPDNSTAPAIAATVHFAKALEKLGLRPATFAGVHQRVYSMQDLQAAIELARKNGTVAAQ
jgi:glyoxylase-like metal-dependent hydrolase (beta-lactamase superfamily II)